MHLAKADIEAGVAERDKTVFFTSTETGEIKTLALYEQTLIVNCASYTCTIQLPYVAEAVGLTFSIAIVSGTEVCTIVDQDDSLGWTDVTIEDTGDTLTVRSNGTQWILVESYEAD